MANKDRGPDSFVFMPRVPDLENIERDLTEDLSCNHNVMDNNAALNDQVLAMRRRDLKTHYHL